MKTSGSSTCFGEKGCVIEISSRPSHEYHRNDSPLGVARWLSSSILQLFEDRNQTRILRLIVPSNRKPETNASDYPSFNFNISEVNIRDRFVLPYRRLVFAQSIQVPAAGWIAVPDLPKWVAADIRVASAVRLNC